MKTGNNGCPPLKFSLSFAPGASPCAARLLGAPLSRVKACTGNSPHSRAFFMKEGRR
eukprot:GSA25T00022116001.1